MRQQSLQRGSAHWPFIITLLLLFVFGYMWFDEKDQREQAQTAQKTADAAAADARQAAAQFLDYAVRLSEKVGWNTQLIGDLVTSESAKTLAGSFPVTNIEQLESNLTPTGTQDGRPGLLNWLINQAEVEIRRDLRTAQSGNVQENPVEFDWMTAEFKQALRRVASMPVPVPPRPVLDADDPTEVSRYASEERAYEEAVAARQAAIDELMGMDGWKQFSKIISGASLLNPDEQSVVKLEFFVQPPASEVTIETLLTYPPKVIEAAIDEFRVNKNADAGVIDQTRADNAAKQTSLDEAAQALSQEEQRHVADVQQLQGELADANQRADSAQLEYTKLQNRVQELEEENRDQQQASATRISALENRIRVDKEVRDLAVRRDDPDGHILAASTLRDTAVIDLGSQDKVFPGLKFNVSRIGKGGVRVPKGQVIVTQVLDGHTAKVAILSADPTNPIMQGDLISNPFYSPTEQIHIVLAGALERYPKEIAMARLARLNVVVQDQIDGDTDYVVIPNSLAAPVESAGEEGEDEGGEPAVQSQLDKIEAQARTFGATVITERILNEFLDY